MASVVVVAEASVLEAVVVAFGGADDVLSVLPQAVILIIVALIIKAAMAFIVFFIWFSSFLDLTYTFCPIRVNEPFSMPHVTIMDAKTAYNYYLEYIIGDIMTSIL